MAEDERAAERDDEWDSVEDDGVLDGSDTLDDDVSDPLDVGIAAADRGSGANRFGTTIAEQRAGETMDQLLAEEEPAGYPHPGAAGHQDELVRPGRDRGPRAGALARGHQG